MTDTSEAAAPSTPVEQLVGMLVDGFVKARAGSVQDEHAGRLAANKAYIEDLEQEMKPLVGQVVDRLLAIEELPPEIRALLTEASEPGHQYGWIIQIGIYIAAMVEVIPMFLQVASQGIRNILWQHNTVVPISPADAADMVIRGVLSNDDGATQAAMSGVSHSDFNNLVDITGEPPGPMDFLKLWLRGDATDDELTHAILYSRIRDEFIPYMKMMAYTQMSPPDAIMAAIKEVVDLPTAKALFVRGGGLDSDFDTLYQAAGDSIGIQQVLTLWKFGLTTEDEVNKALGRSRINPMFYPLAKLTHFHPLSAFQISKAITSGTITPAQGEQWLVQNGVPQDQAHALANAHSSGGTTKAHSETETMVTQAYDDHLLGHAEAYQALLDIGYHADVATLILNIADAKYALKQQGHAVTVVRANYTSHRISRGTASSDLDALQVPAAARDEWLRTWDLEIAAHPKTLTAVQLADAGAKKLLSEDVVFARIQQEGYTAEDAKVLMELHKATPPAGA